MMWPSRDTAWAVVSRNDTFDTMSIFFFFQAEDGIRDYKVTGVQTCALPIFLPGYSGIRPKTAGPGEPAPDFLIQGPRSHGVAGLVHLFGIESPGLTASLALDRKSVV